MSEFQKYLNDISTESTILAFFQSLLDDATDFVYTYLGRDYTASATRSLSFMGTDLDFHIPPEAIETPLTWKTLNSSAVETNIGVMNLYTTEKGMVLRLTNGLVFTSGVEHRITYQTSASLTCPEAVKLAIIEIAATFYEESKQGSSRLGMESELTLASGSRALVRFETMLEKQFELLAPFRRFAI